MFEHRSQPLVSRRRFAVRIAKCLAIAVAIDTLAIGVGAVGFHWWGKMDWLSACVNGAMVMTGNGMVSGLQTSGGQLFSMFDAVFGVLAFVSVAGVVLAPVLHRLMHTFHLEVGDDGR